MSIPGRIGQWLAARGISEEVTADAGLAWDGSLVIPVLGPDGSFLFNKYRRDPDSDGGPKYRYDRGAVSALYGAHLLPGTSAVVVTEGELDSLRLRSMGLAAVSPTGGAGNWKPEWAALLAGKEVTVCYDSDAAGIAGALRVLASVPWAKAAWLPERTKDATEFIASEGEGEFRKVLAAAEACELPVPGMSEAEIRRKVDALMLRKRAVAAARGDTRPLRAQVDLWMFSLSDALGRKKRRRKVPEPAGETDRLAAAKARPVTDFVEFDRRGFARCVWHEEERPSMHLVPKTGKVKCFSCGAAGDVIDVVAAQRGCGTGEAIRVILGN